MIEADRSRRPPGFHAGLATTLGVVGAFAGYSADIAIRVGDPMTPHIRANFAAIPSAVIGAAAGIGISYLAHRALTRFDDGAETTSNLVAGGIALGIAAGLVAGHRTGRASYGWADDYQGAERASMLFQEFAGHALPMSVYLGAVGGIVGFGPSAYAHGRRAQELERRPDPTTQD